MPRLLCLLILLLAQSAHAQWSPQHLQALKAMDEKYASINHTGVATFWGGFKRKMRLNFNDGDTLAWETPLFKHGSLPLYYSEREGAAPLVVIMPGIFGTTDKGLTPSTIDRVEAMGAHVIVVPNVVSVQYVHAYPLYGGDIVESEAQVMEAALEFALSKMGKKVTAVHVLAESLGTVVASAWTAWDVTHKKRINSLTLLSPPMDLSAAMRNFDDIINEYRGTSEQCSQFSLYWRLFTDFLISEIPSDFALKEKRCLSGYVVVDAFLKAAQSTYLAHAVAINDSSAYTVKSFEDFFRRYRPELWSLLETKDARLKLAKWVSVIRKHSGMPIRIITSRDDFLNRGLSWNDFLNETGVSNDHLYIFSWGGHSGIIAPPELDVILKEIIAPI